jgi:hypothetical protein
MRPKPSDSWPPDRAVETSQSDAALASASTAQDCYRVLGLVICLRLRA